MMIPVQEAEAIILTAIAPLTETESVDLEKACGRVLGQDVKGNLDIPHWHSESRVDSIS